MDGAQRAPERGAGGHADPVRLARARRDAARWLALILCVAAVARLAAVLSHAQLPWFHAPEVDALLYRDGGRAFAQGHLAIAPGILPSNPGYYYFVGLASAAFGPSPWTVPVLQALLGLGVVALTFDMARRLFGVRWAILPGVLSALYGPYLFYEGQLLSAALATFLEGLLLWMLIRALRARDGRFGTWALAGLVWGVASTVRPNALLLLVPAALVAFGALEGRRRWLAPLVMGAAGLLAIAPVTARNLATTGEPVLLTANGGMNFFIGNGPGAVGTYGIPAVVGGPAEPLAQARAFHRVAERAVGHALDDTGVDTYWWNRTVRTMAGHPWRSAALLIRKAHLFWNGRELSNVFNYAFMCRVDAVLRGPVVQGWMLLPFALLGTLLLLARADPAERLVGLFVVTSFAVLVAFFIVARYRLPTVPALMLAATEAVRRLALLARGRRWIHLAAAGGALAVAVALAVPVPAKDDFALQYLKLGTGLFDEWRMDEATTAFEASVRHDPTYLRAHNNLALAYERTARYHAALGQWRITLRLARTQNEAVIAKRAQRHIAWLRATRLRALVHAGTF